MVENDMKPCPFCGEAMPLLIQFDGSDVAVAKYDIGRTGVAYVCKRCGARGGVVSMSDYGSLSASVPIARSLWNRREWE